MQNISVRDNQGNVRTTNVIGGKILPYLSSRDREREQGMQIGDLLRTIVVEPLELPVQQPAAEPELVPAPEPEPKQVPVAQ
jgi:hypothetical protein